MVEKQCEMNFFTIEMQWIFTLSDSFFLKDVQK